MRASEGTLFAAAVVAFAIAMPMSAARAEEPVPPPRPSHNLFGMTGNIDTPTADMQPDGQFSLTTGYFGGQLRNTLSVQILPGVEGAFRYSTIRGFFRNRGGRDSGRTLFDRSFDIKLRILEESSRWPALAIGLQDFLGTGIYSSEYIVATKGITTEKYGSFRISSGIGWGRFADQNVIDNPLAAIDRFSSRGGDFGEGGNVNFGQYFSGTDLGFFGGVEWSTPIDGLTAKIEYSPDQYSRERLFSDLDQNVPINFGLEYRALQNVEVGAYYMYGTEFGVRVTLTGNPFRPITEVDLLPGAQPLRPRPPPEDNVILAALGEVVEMIGGDDVPPSFNDPRLADVMVHTRLGTVRWAEAQLTRGDIACPDELAEAIDAHYGVIDVVTFSRPDGGVLCTVALRPAGQHAIRVTSRSPESYPTDWYDQPEVRDELMQSVADELEAEDLGLVGLEIAPRRVEVYIRNTRYRSEPRAIGRVARALTRTLPPSVEIFEITPVDRSIPLVTIVLNRSQLEDQVGRPDADKRSWATASVRSADPVPMSTLVQDGGVYPKIGWRIEPGLPASLFDPDSPFRIDLGVVASGSIEFVPGFSFNGSVFKRIIGTLDDITRESDSRVEERVRSEIAQYLREGDPAITRMTFDYVTKLNPEFYGRVSGGLLERMYAGFSGEVLWKPATQDWGLGLEVNYVRQRDFNGLFDMISYDTVTGHASFYWDTNFYGLSTQVDVGRYLAGDWGGTFAMKRRFPNGWEIGGFFTLTEIPFSEFGEGSFDKGIFLTIPFNWGLPYESRAEYSTVLRPLTRDGGQRVGVGGRLYPLVEDQDVGFYRQTWDDFWQ